MNKKQFATKLIASMLSAYFLVPCTSTFGVDSQPESEEAVSLSEKNQEALNDEDAQEYEDEQEDEDAQENENKQKNKDAQKSKDKEHSQKKSILRNPGVQVVGGGIGLGVLIFGGPRLWKRFSSGRHPQSPAGGGSVTPPAAPVESQTLHEDRTGWNELHHAAEADNLGAFNDLTITDQRLRQRDTRGRTPFYIAVKYHPESQIIRNWLDGLDHKLHTVGEGGIGDERFSHIIYDTLVTAVRNDDVQTLTNLVNTVMPSYTPDSERDPENKLEILNFLAEHGRRFVNDDDRGSFIDRIFADPNLSGENRLEILRSLKDHGFDFKINGNRRPMSEACVQLWIATLKQRIVLVKFYIEDCNALSYMDTSDRDRIIGAINMCRNDAIKDELLNYFNRKCSEQPNAPIAQPDATAAGASTQPGAPNAQPGTMAAGEGSGSETTTEGTPPNQGHTTGSSDAQPSRPLTREEMREQRLAALARRRNNNTPNPQ